MSETGVLPFSCAFRTALIDMSGDFRPFFETAGAKASKSSINSFSPIASPSPSPAAVAPVAAAACGEVKVELKRDGERISEIRVLCRCGEVIELACEY
jgi:hypothetical protein